MRKKITSANSHLFDLDGNTIEEVRELLTELEVLYGSEAKLNFTCDYDGDTSCHVTTSRLETDTEYEARMCSEVAEDAQAKARRQRRYEELKKEFE